MRVSLSGCSLVLLADLQLELGHSALQLQQLHVKGGLLASQCRHLLLQTRVLGFLMRVVSLHLLLDLKVLVSESLAHLLCLEGEHAFESILLGAEHLNFTLVVVQLFGKLLDHILFTE